MVVNGDLGFISSGKRLHNENHNFEEVIQLWAFSIAMLVYQRVIQVALTYTCLLRHIYKSLILQEMLFDVV